MDDDEYSELQQFLMRNPDLGELIPGSGGVRKIRWARTGMGKRGGLRIIYYVRWLCLKSPLIHTGLQPGVRPEPYGRKPFSTVFAVSPGKPLKRFLDDLSAVSPG